MNRDRRFAYIVRSTRRSLCHGTASTRGQTRTAGGSDRCRSGSSGSFSIGRPISDDPRQRVKFGTSGHRGTPLDGSLTAAHIAAITQAICDYRRSQAIDGPLYMGKDTHALSSLSQDIALEVLAGNERRHDRAARRWIHADAGHLPRDSGAQPRPHRAPGRRHRDHSLAQPAGGRRFQVQPAERRPRRHRRHASGLQQRANELLAAKNERHHPVPLAAALKASTTHHEDFVRPYVDDLNEVVDMEAIRDAGVTIGVDPLGGASLPYWQAIASRHALQITIVNSAIDPTFAFMTLDHDGKIRMDCSSPYAMASLVALKDRFQVAVGNDPDADRHGIVTASAGLMNPNHYLAVAIQYLLANRPGVACRRRDRQDRRQQQHDRSRHERGRAAPGGSAGGLQVVRRAPLRKPGLLRRRRKRRRELPAQGRHRLDDRQGRVDHGAPRRRDHRAHRQGSGRALPCPRSAVRRLALHENRRAGHAAAEGATAEAVAGSRNGHEPRR